VYSATYMTDDVRHVPNSEKFAVEKEYGMRLAKYGKALEIDHIVSLELGGSNDIANLFPERRDVAPGYKVKDKLENRLRVLVCTKRTMTLRAVQIAIARDWEKLYKTVYGTNP
jgi:hypothetical protein